MNKASLQSAFDKATSALIAQGQKSGSGVMCYYRMLKGDAKLACAVGHLMTDEQMARYSVSEGMSVYDAPKKLLDEILPGVSLMDARDFLGSLQSAHDMCTLESFVEDFKRNARDVARSWNLTVNF